MTELCLHPTLLALGIALRRFLTGRLSTAARWPGKCTCSDRAPRPDHARAVHIQYTHTRNERWEDGG